MINLNRFCLLSLIVLLLPVTGQAGDYDPANMPGDLMSDLRALPTGENGRLLLLGAGLTLLVHQFEDPDGAERALDQGLIDGVVDFGNIWAEKVVQIPLALGCWGIGSATDNDEVAGFGYDLSRGLLLMYGITGVIKTVVNRTRPNGSDLSFPSGHTATAFCVAGVITRRYDGWREITSVGLGILTALGRMEDRKHFASDVVAGATIGWVIGRTVARRGRGGRLSLQLVPLQNGLALTGRF
jgi:membrane-associated phospholipid phosphatase